MKTMKTYSLFFCFLFLTFTITFAQPPKYADLFEMYAEENYKKLITKAEKYCLDEKTKNDPWAHYWLGKGLFRISFQNDRSSDFKNAASDAIISLKTALKKDKSHDLIDKEKDFFIEVKNSLLEQAVNEATVKNHKKCGLISRKSLSLFPDDIPSKLLDAYSKSQLKEIQQAEIIWVEIEHSIQNLNYSNWTEKEKENFRFILLFTIDEMIKDKKSSEAKKIALKAKEMYPTDEEINKKISSFN